LPDERLGLFGRRRPTSRPRRNPLLGFFQGRGAQQQAARRLRRRPTTRLFAEFGVLANPLNVRTECCTCSKFQFDAVESWDKRQAASPILRGSTFIAMMQAANFREGNNVIACGR
jgi:hypothetical protein